jgi:hypothetical protein
MTVPYALTETSLTIVLDCIPHVIPNTHQNYQAILDGIKTGASESDLESLVNIPKAIESYMQGNITIRDRVVYYKDRECNNYLAKHILRFMESSDPELVSPLVSFLDNVMENPSYRAVQGLFEWTAKSNLPITSDGHLLAWKIVGENYRDLHSGRFDNSIGQIVEQPRYLCDEDPDQTCSSGLHFCSYDYLPHYGCRSGRRIMIVKIHPRDVVAFPRDYDTAKGRCCRYEVVGEVPEEKVPEFFRNTYVYGGFDETRPEFLIGQVWLEDDDDEHIIVNIDNEHIYTKDEYDDRYVLDLEGVHQAGFCLVELLEEAPEPKPDILPGQVDMKVGQVWETQAGDRVTVESRHDYSSGEYGDSFVLSNRMDVWGFNGDRYATIIPGKGHLKRLIQDL